MTISKKHEKPSHFFCLPLQKIVGGRKKFETCKNVCIYMSDYCVKISRKSNNHALQNLSSNPTAKISRINSNWSEIWNICLHHGNFKLKKKSWKLKTFNGLNGKFLAFHFVQVKHLFLDFDGKFNMSYFLHSLNLFL